MCAVYVRVQKFKLFFGRKWKKTRDEKRISKLNRRDLSSYKFFPLFEIIFIAFYF